MIINSSLKNLNEFNYKDKHFLIWSKRIKSNLTGIIPKDGTFEFKKDYDYFNDALNFLTGDEFKKYLKYIQETKKEKFFIHKEKNEEFINSYTPTVFKKFILSLCAIIQGIRDNLMKEVSEKKDRNQVLKNIKKLFDVKTTDGVNKIEDFDVFFYKNLFEGSDLEISRKLINEGGVFKYLYFLSKQDDSSLFSEKGPTTLYYKFTNFNSFFFSSFSFEDYLRKLYDYLNKDAIKKLFKEQEFENALKILKIKSKISLNRNRINDDFKDLFKKTTTMFEDDYYRLPNKLKSVKLYNYKIDYFATSLDLIDDKEKLRNKNDKKEFIENFYEGYDFSQNIITALELFFSRKSISNDLKLLFLKTTRFNFDNVINDKIEIFFMILKIQAYPSVKAAFLLNQKLRLKAGVDLTDFLKRLNKASEDELETINSEIITPSLSTDNFVLLNEENAKLIINYILKNPLPTPNKKDLPKTTCLLIYLLFGESVLRKNTEEEKILMEIKEKVHQAFKETINW